MDANAVNVCSHGVIAIRSCPFMGALFAYIGTSL